MLKNVEVLNHSCVRISKGKTIYVDPYNVSKEYNDADIIFITHEHYDHYSKEDIKKVKKDDTIIVVPEDLEEKAQTCGIIKNNIICVKPNNRYKIYDINIETIPAYNINKQFHLKEKQWVGYVIEIEDIRYYIAGDTDINEENKCVKCDVAFVPVGGTYTMDYKEAANFINSICPKIAVPIHYGSVVGSKEDAVKFVQLLDKEILGVILM